MMSVRKAGMWNVLISIGFALVITLLGITLSDKQFAITAMMVLLGIWLVPFAWLSRQAQVGERSDQY
ncbi:hypothetical protein NFHSH190041_28760 [Shewanella sp. NFH-SH190041]|uniref:hypothetical protein n=1 Tax=Shewanella sp. NFH-SH190041 TaxID=2950245 RepID=UPI0021C291CB|nr:hypothetical protein [Shewanella sp. NFH-SH190041]BDM65424.1 hypothetical protein NFHSH190041_28760 [Shewanella sp. NFH-SH190041]